VASLAELVWLLRKNWKPFLFIVVPAVLVVWMVFPPAVASAIFLLALVAAVVLIGGGFFRNLVRGYRGR